MKVILPSFLILLGYVIGSIPPGAWLVKFYGRDITKYGSGNSGATNVGRLLGTKGFILVFLMDSLKAYCYLWVLLRLQIPEQGILLGAMSLLIGNGYSLFLQGYGGKGVATSAGILLALAPILFLIDFFCWVIFFIITKTVGIASVGACFCLPFIFYFFQGSSSLRLLVVFVSIWGILRHRVNINDYFCSLMILEKNEI